jgi:hypothetical protein
MGNLSSLQQIPNTQKVPKRVNMRNFSPEGILQLHLRDMASRRWLDYVNKFYTTDTALK